MPGTIGNLLGAGLILDGQEFMLAGGSFYKSEGSSPLQPNKSLFSLSINSPKLNSNSQSEWEYISTTNPPLQSNITTLQGAPLTLLPRSSGWRTYATDSSYASRQIDFLAKFISSINPKPQLDPEILSPLFQFDFDKNSKQLSRKQIATQSNLGYSLCQRPNGEKYMLGGLGTNGVASTEFYLLEDQPKSLIKGPPSYFHSTECLKNQLVLLGGFQDQQLREFKRLNIYDYISGWKIEPTSGSVPSPRYLHATSTLPNGNVVVSGGLDSNNKALNDIYLLDTQSWSWTKHNLPLEPRFGHSLAVYINHLVIVQGWAQVPFKASLSRRAIGDPKIVVIDTQKTPWVIVDSIIFNTPVQSTNYEPSPESNINPNLPSIIVGSIIGGIFLIFIIIGLIHLIRRRNSKPHPLSKFVLPTMNKKNHGSDITYLETIRDTKELNYSMRPNNEFSNHIYHHLNAQSNTSCQLPQTSTTLPDFANHSKVPISNLEQRFHPSEVVEDRDLYDTGIALTDTNPPPSIRISSTIRTPRNPPRSSSDSQFITVLSAGSNLSGYY